METRMTNQKLKIMEHLQKVRTHPTAEMVYHIVSKDLPAISLATVYRNLNLLAEQGKILRLEINGEYHYDGFCDSHQHLVCTNCGKIMDLGQKEISNYAMKKIKSSDFELKSVRIIFYGVCKNCKEK
jgi:Fe2+ or Zn2+ uptake regulation protein